MNRIALVSCVAGKLARPSPAADLYISSWFLKARRVAETKYDHWFILSAEHGLVPPTKVIAPYERTLNTMKISDRRRWAEQVEKQMDEMLPHAEEVIVFAGERYREFLLPYLVQRHAAVSVPMKGMRIGQQLSWLDHEAAR